MHNASPRASAPVAFAAPPGAGPDPVTITAGQFITCTLDAAEYGIDIMAVREIRGWAATTAIPHAPPWIRGVINLRGIIVPIVDMRIKFNLGTPTYDQFTVVIILNIVFW